MSKELNELIDKLVEDKTFTAEAVEGIQQLREDNIALTEKCESYKELVNKTDLRSKNLNAEVVDYQKTIAKLNAEIEANAVFVNQARENHTVARVAAAEARAFREAMQIVFKPVTMRETVQRNASGFTNNQPVNSIDSETRTTDHD